MVLSIRLSIVFNCLGYVNVSCDLMKIIKCSIRHLLKEQIRLFLIVIWKKIILKWILPGDSFFSVLYTDISFSSIDGASFLTLYFNYCRTSTWLCHCFLFELHKITNLIVAVVENIQAIWFLLSGTLFCLIFCSASPQIHRRMVDAKFIQSKQFLTISLKKRVWCRAWQPYLKFRSDTNFPVNIVVFIANWCVRRDYI